MPIVRVESVYMENGFETEDKMIFDVFVQTNNQIKPMEIFGYAMESGEKWPFTIKEIRQVWSFDWGAAYNDTESIINILEKQVVVGELFTRTDKIVGTEEEYSYKIKRIFNWDDIT